MKAKLNKDQAKLMLIELHREYWFCTKMREKYESEENDSGAVLYVGKMTGLDSAIRIIRKSADISYEEYIETVASE